MFVWEVLLLSPLLLCSPLITTLHPGPADSLLCSSKSWGIPLSTTVQTPHHTQTHTNSGTFGASGTPSPTQACMDTRISAHTVTQARSRIQWVSGQAGLAATVDWACGEIFTEHAEPICGCSSVTGGSWLCVCLCMCLCECCVVAREGTREGGKRFVCVWVTEHPQNEG